MSRNGRRPLGEDLEERPSAQALGGIRPDRLPRPPRIRHDQGIRPIEGYRDRGGNLVFLSANNFYWQVELPDAIEKTQAAGATRAPEAALIGVQYIG